MKGYDEEITCEIFDKESMGKDDSIGKGILHVDNLIATAKNAKNSMDFELFYKGPLGMKTKCAGKVYITLRYEDHLESKMQNTTIEETKDPLHYE